MPVVHPSALLFAAVTVLLVGLTLAATPAPPAGEPANNADWADVAAPAPPRHPDPPRPADPPGPVTTAGQAAPAPPPDPGGLLPPVDPDALRTLAARTGIPLRALQAYAGAHLRMREERPGCNLDWTLLAAIGHVESGHGTHGGGHIDADGNATVPIIGPALDGSPGVRAIRDTDGGALDGDLVWDRAVGPMQFIPSTWARWGVDATGNGVADPHHIDDAALSAARYLCAGGGDLRQADAWSRAVLRYNDSREYLHRVLQINNAYARASHGG